MTQKSITVTEALELHKETKEAYDFASDINIEVGNRLMTMTKSQQSIVVEVVSSYFRATEMSWYFNLEKK